MKRKGSMTYIPANFKKLAAIGTACCLFSLIVNISTGQAGDLLSTICNNNVVSVGEKQAAVLQKCGPPLSDSPIATKALPSQIRKKSRNNQSKTTATAGRNVRRSGNGTWAYNIDGSYRFFIFTEGRLEKIETGGLAD